MGNPNPLHLPPQRGQAQAEPPEGASREPLLAVRALDPAGTGRGSSGAQPLQPSLGIERRRRRV